MTIYRNLSMMKPVRHEYRTYGQYYCSKCDVKFSTLQQKLAHMEMMAKNGFPGHLACKTCGEAFHSQEALGNHVRLEHPQSQELTCPACNAGPFKTYANFICHIEKGGCRQLSRELWDQMRQDNLEFQRNLKKLTNEPIKHDYSDCLPAITTAKYHKAQGLECLRMAAAAAIEHPEDVKKGTWPAPSESKIKKASPCACQPVSDSNGVRNIMDVDNEELELDLAGQPIEPEPVHPAEVHKKSWSTWGKQLFPDAPPALAPTAEQLEAAKTLDAKAVHELIDPDSPDHPDFNPARYYNPYAEKFQCPKCWNGKLMKTAGGLIAHLRSEAHSDCRYWCPVCRRLFKSLTALAAHAEANTGRCFVGESRGYGAIVSQATAGILDVATEKRADGTNKYMISKTAKEAIERARAEGRRVQEQKVVLSSWDDIPEAKPLVWDY